MKKNIYLVGFMASGKTEVGKALSKRLKRPFLDMDARLERTFSRPLHRVFAEHGESAFRTEERRLLREISSKRGVVVATGGGAVSDPDNVQVMKESGTVVHLNADFQTCLKRIEAAGAETRPMWTNPADVERLFESRKADYARADMIAAVDGKSPSEIAESLATDLTGEARLDVRLGDAECPIIATTAGPDALSRIAQGRRVFLLTDRTVARLHLERYARGLADAETFLVHTGERSKSLKTAQRIYEALIERRFDRDDLLVALGGGVITDLGAYVASTFKRGMGLALVSTTLLGCVDAAIGGKAAVNLGSVKNVVGCFSVPEAVILDLTALGTLDPTHVSEGLVEAYKTGLIAEPDLADLIERESASMLAGDPILQAETAILSARTKARIVGEDFTEKGRRMILNFGHTFGHAVESHNNFKASHGQCVAVGMRLAAEISRMRGLLTAAETERISDVTRSIRPEPVSLPSPEKAWEMMLRDKKIRGGRMVFVLLEGRGRAVVKDDLMRDEFAEALKSASEGGHG